MTKLLDFAADESGAVVVDWVVLTAAIAGLTIAVTGLIANGLNRQSSDMSDVMTNEDIVFASRNFGQSPLELAQAVERTHYGANWVNNRMDRLMNELTDQQLRNQLNTWTARAGDPTHQHHSKAADQLALLEIAMDARGVTP